MLIILISFIDINLLKIHKIKSIYDKLLLATILGIIVCAFLFLLLNILSYKYRFIVYGTPLGLVFGPILYFFKNIKYGNDQKVYIKYTHLLPFLFALIYYVFFLIKNFNSGETENNNTYYLVLYTLSALSWFSYALWLIFKQLSIKKEERILKLENIVPDSATYIALIIISVYNIATIFTRYEDLSFIIKTFNFSFLLFVIWILFLFYYMLSTKLSKHLYSPEIINEEKETVIETLTKEPEKEKVKYKKSQLSDKQIYEYKIKIENYIKKEPYLNPNFDLELMSNNLKIYKHHCSQLFNTFYGVNFPNFINKIRIEKACSYLEKNDSITIEEIANLCGFNSRASFYRNFNKIMGCNPMEYKQKVSDSK